MQFLRLRRLLVATCFAPALCFCGSNFAPGSAGDTVDAGDSGMYSPPVVIPIVSPEAGDSTTAGSTAGNSAPDAMTGDVMTAADGGSDASRCTAPL